MLLQLSIVRNPYLQIYIEEVAFNLRIGNFRNFWLLMRPLPVLMIKFLAAEMQKL